MTAQTALPFARTFAELIASPELAPSTARSAFDAILEGTYNPAQIAAFLGAVAARPLTARLVAAAAQAMRAAMVPVEHSLDLVLDTCGTGGDGRGTINLSTGAAIVLAAAGVPVAKHGNRAVSSRAGSADVLEQLGIGLETSPLRSRELLEQLHIAFLMAPVHHPAMRHAAPIRRELGVRTIFNCLGPLANPARATHQLVGAFSDPIRRVLAEALGELGTHRAWVVFGADGLDEVSPFGPTRVSELSHGRVTELEFVPEDFGLPRLAEGAIDGGDAVYNAAVLEQILTGTDHPALPALILNAAAALVVARDLSPRAATTIVEQVLQTGAAKNKLADWRAKAGHS